MIILDASAVLATLQNEAGNDAVDMLFETQACAMSIVNLTEVLERLANRGMPLAIAHELTGSLDLKILPFELAESTLTAALHAATARTGIGLADRACIATGMRRDAAILTADRAWATLDLPDADIRLIR